MKSTPWSFLKVTLYVFIISMLIVLPVMASWSSRLTQDDIDTFKMWIRLAWNGYADPLKVEQPDKNKLEWFNWWK